MGNGKNSPWGMNTTVFSNPNLFFKTLERQILNKVCVSMPCQIVSYDRDTHVAEVRPMLNYRVKACPDSECSNIKIEIRRMMAGGFLIDFPIAKDDTGWLIAVDRDCYQVKNTSKPALPAGAQCNCYKTGFWIPDQWGSQEKLGIANVDENRLVIQSKDGTQKISVGDGDIHITATKVYVTAPNTEISGNVSIGGNLNVVGTIKETTANVTLSTHTHKENGVPGNPDTQSPTTGT